MPISLDLHYSLFWFSAVRSWREQARFWEDQSTHSSETTNTSRQFLHLLLCHSQSYSSFRKPSSFLHLPHQVFFFRNSCAITSKLSSELLGSQHHQDSSPFSAWSSQRQWRPPSSHSLSPPPSSSSPNHPWFDALPKSKPTHLFLIHSLLIFCQPTRPSSVPTSVGSWSFSPPMQPHSFSCLSVSTVSKDFNCLLRTIPLCRRWWQPSFTPWSLQTLS